MIETPVQSVAQNVHPDTMNRKRMAHPIYAWVYLLALLTAYMAVGWILAAYAAPLIVWIWTILLIAYVAWANTGAIAGAMLWVVSVVWIAAYTNATPLLMNWKGPTWAISLVGVWIFAIGVVLILAFARPAVQALGWSHKGTFHRLLLLTGAGLFIGRFLYLGSISNAQSLAILCFS